MRAVSGEPTVKAGPLQFTETRLLGKFVCATSGLNHALGGVTSGLYQLRLTGTHSPTASATSSFRTRA